ncbi:biotin--[acetyl-CoA-carboxylase] ligase, partial [Herbaspirillum frisingense]
MTLTFPMPAESESAPLVRPERIGMLLAGSDRDGQQRIDVEAVAQTGSTNVDLMQRLSSLQRPLLLVADRQTAGRGRAGRPWR